MKNQFSYSSVTISDKFSKILIKHGKKSTATQIIKKCFEYLPISKKGELYLIEAISLVQPVVEIRSLRRGGRTLLVPFPIRKKRSFHIGCSWIIKAAKKRKHIKIEKALALELIDIHKYRGDIWSYRDNINKQVWQNRGNSYIRWL